MKGLFFGLNLFLNYRMLFLSVVKSHLKSLQFVGQNIRIKNISKGLSSILKVVLAPIPFVCDAVNFKAVF